MYYYEQEEYSLAIKKCNDLIERFPNSAFVVDAKLIIAESKIHLADCEQGFEELDGLILEYPEMAAKIINRMADHFYLCDGTYEQAVEFYKKVIDQFPDSSNEYVHACFSLAEIYRTRWCQYDKAIKCYTLIVNRSVTEVESYIYEQAFYFIGVCYYFLDDCDNALTWLDEYLHFWWPNTHAFAGEAQWLIDQCQSL